VPYIDRDRRGSGIWFSTKKGPAIVVLSAIYTAILEIGLVIFDEKFFIAGMPEGSHGLGPFIKWELMNAFHVKADAVAWVGEIFIPIILMIAIPWILVSIVRRRYKANTREVMIALYSFYLTSFVVLSLIGTAFRGTSMHLVWPWELLPPH
jgi:menaquinol-cytochrome c reductase cytochrome b/c subunit